MALAGETAQRAVQHVAGDAVAEPVEDHVRADKTTWPQDADVGANKNNKKRHVAGEVDAGVDSRGSLQTRGKDWHRPRRSLSLRERASSSCQIHQPNAEVSSVCS